MKTSKTLIFLAIVIIVWSCAKEELVPDLIREPHYVAVEKYSSHVITDTLQMTCPCFSKESLDELLQLDWESGWWSDEGGCKPSPYTDLVEIWIPYAQVDGIQLDISLQAGHMNGNPFASSSVYNHKKGAYDMICGGYIAQEKAAACTRLLVQHIKCLAVSHPELDYCKWSPAQ